MANYLCALLLLSVVVLFSQASTQNFLPRPPNAPTRQQYQSLESTHRLRRVASESRPILRVLQPPPMMTRPTEPVTPAQYHGPIKRGGPPYLVIRPMSRSKRPRTNRRLVLTLPKDNIQILNAEAMTERGSQMLPTTLTLSLRDSDSSESGKEPSRYSTTSYASQIPSPLRQSSRFRYGFVPMTHADSEEEDRGGRNKGRWSKGEVSYEFDDLVGSSGGHVTVIKAKAAPQPKVLSARKYRGGQSLKSMKAIIIQPKEIEAKRVTVVKTNAEQVTPMKAQYVKAGSPMITSAIKTKAHPLSYKKATITKSKGEDWAASNVHYVNAEPPQDAAERHQDEEMPPMSELQCGGTNDLGWCDLGTNYPNTEVSQIMEVCEELVSRMYVEVPENAGIMEDIASYSLSRNISENGPRAYWPWKESAAHFKKPLCDVERGVIKPSFAQDIRGKWHVIIQTESFPQRITLEVCSKPGEPCSSNELCNNSQSQCVQKYSHHQLISFDPESAETCPYVRLYKFPTSCVCRTAE